MYLAVVYCLSVIRFEDLTVSQLEALYLSELANMGLIVECF